VHQIFDEPASLREAPARRLVARALMVAVGPSCRSALTEASEAAQRPEAEPKTEAQREPDPAEARPPTEVPPTAKHKDRPRPGRAGLPGTRRKLGWNGLILTPILAGLLWVLLGAASDCIGLHRLGIVVHRTRWRLDGAEFVETHSPALRIRMTSCTSAKSGTRRYHQVVTLSIRDGQRLEHKVGQGGECDRTPGPPPLEGRDRPIIDGDAIGLSSSTAMARRMLVRRPPTGAPRWQREVAGLFGAENRPIRFVADQGGRIFLIAEEGVAAVDDLYVVALDAQDGSTVWSRVFW